MSRLEMLRQRAGGAAIERTFRGLSGLGRLHPRARRALRSVEVTRDVPYLDDGHPAHRLDVYRPKGPGPFPVLLYIHGGGFRILSKETHWAMALRFARRGYLVFNAEYRLAPRDPFPAAVEDACGAYAWVARHAESYGGDLSRLALAGESAGGNLVTSLAVASSWELPEPWARSVWDTGVSPRAVVAACGLLQASDCERFGRRRKLPRIVADRLEEIERAYLPATIPRDPHTLALADPVVWLERGQAPQRPLPPFFAPVGTRDPILDDTRRLDAAVRALGGDCEARYYPGELHAFHAFMWRANAAACWRETFDFLGRSLG